jgi:Spy/CpxP family protein refolding chaperone
MKNTSPTLVRAASAVLLTGLLGLASTLTAQDAPRRPAAPGAPAAPGGEQRRPDGGDPRRDFMVFDEKQRELMRAAFEKHGEELRKLGEQISEARKALIKAMTKEKPDEKEVREKAEALAKLQVESYVLRAKALGPVSSSLTAEQRERLETSQFAGSMVLGDFGGGRGGDRGGPGGRGGDRGGPGGAPGGDRRGGREGFEAPPGR